MNGFKFITDWSTPKQNRKKFQSQKHEDVKPPAVFQSDEETDTDFESDSDYSGSNQALKEKET